MKKTSVYLSDADRALLERLARRKRTSRAQVLREALAAYDAANAPARGFALDAAYEGEGRPFADFTEEELGVLMEGFGE